MTTSARKASPTHLKFSSRARHVSFGDDTLVIDLEDGRQFAVPIAWFPRLAGANAAQRANWEFVGRGIGISWPDIDEDISVENLLGADGELLIAAADVGLQVGIEKQPHEARSLSRDQMAQLMEAAKAGEREHVDQVLREMGLKGQALEIARMVIEHPEWDDIEAFPEMTIAFHLQPNRPPVFEVSEAPGAASEAGAIQTAPRGGKVPPRYPPSAAAGS